MARRRPTLPPLAGAVPWALGAFTAEFGMGSGGSPPPGPPGHGAAASVASRACTRRTDIRSRLRRRGARATPPARTGDPSVCGWVSRGGRGPGGPVPFGCARAGYMRRAVVFSRPLARPGAGPRHARGRGRALGAGRGTGGTSALGRLGPVGCTRRRASTPGLSTWWSPTALMGRPGLEGGFPLRCRQRLSRPDVATRRCGWRHNRNTRGPSAPVLSY